VSRPRRLPVSLAARFGLLLLLLLCLQALLTGLLVSRWIRARDLALHQVELREQAGLILPAVEDSLRAWAGMGPLISRRAELRHRMQLSLGRPQVMSLVWLDAGGNLAAAGFLAEDPRLGELKELALAGLSPAALERWAAARELALVARPAAEGWLLLAGSRGGCLWRSGGQGLLIAILAVSAAIAGLAAWLLARPLLRRLGQFHAAFIRLGRGEMDSRLPTGRDDELGGLAREFNRMAARLEDLTAELEKGDRRRRQLVSEVSHELGAPLTTIMGNLDLLLRQPLPDETRRAIQLCMAQARRLDALVTDLLDLARLDEAGLHLQRRPLDLADLVDGEIAAVELACLDRGIALEWRRPATPALVLADESRLAQVLRNLLRNAVNQLAAGPEGEARLAVRLETAEDQVRLEVEDNGPGIHPADLAYIFDRYHRPHSSRGEGSGLGLCISRRLAELHDGALEGLSRGVSQGAVFVLTLPRAH
jgi:signal transduction histidine kinase